MSAASAISSLTNRNSTNTSANGYPDITFNVDLKNVFLLPGSTDRRSNVWMKSKHIIYELHSPPNHHTWNPISMNNCPFSSRYSPSVKFNSSFFIDARYSHFRYSVCPQNSDLRPSVFLRIGKTSLVLMRPRAMNQRRFSNWPKKTTMKQALLLLTFALSNSKMSTHWLYFKLVN
jgi:hypothetical protein